MSNNGNRDWAGWRWSDSGRYLISPDGDKMTAQRLKGLLWRDAQELRLAGFASRQKADTTGKKRAGFGGQKVKVVIVDLADWHEQRFGRSG